MSDAAEDDAFHNKSSKNRALGRIMVEKYRCTMYGRPALKK
jgi:hypothetical protein